MYFKCLAVCDLPIYVLTWIILYGTYITDVELEGVEMSDVLTIVALYLLNSPVVGVAHLMFIVVVVACTHVIVFTDGGSAKQ